MATGDRSQTSSTTDAGKDAEMGDPARRRGKLQVCLLAPLQLVLSSSPSLPLLLLPSTACATAAAGSHLRHSVAVLLLPLILSSVVRPLQYLLHVRPA